MTADALYLLHQALFGAMAAAGFGILFNFGWRDLPWCAASGAMALATRTLGQGAGWSQEAASFAAAALVGGAARLLGARLPFNVAVGVDLETGRDRGPVKFAIGSYVLPSLNDGPHWLGRIDHNQSEAHRLSLRFSYDSRLIWPCPCGKAAVVSFPGYVNDTEFRHSNNFLFQETQTKLTGGHAFPYGVEFLRQNITEATSAATVRRVEGGGGAVEDTGLRRAEVSMKSTHVSFESKQLRRLHPSIIRGSKLGRGIAQPDYSERRKFRIAC
jgi:hypothetical protein